MEFNIKNILNIQENSSANYVISKYLNCVEDNVICLVSEITEFNIQKKYFILPQSNIKIACNIKKLIISGYLIMNELTNNPVALVQADLILKNEKLSTPDVLFFQISLFQDFFNKKSITNFNAQIEKILAEIKKITSLNPEYFDVNLQDYSKLNLEESEIVPLTKND